MFSIYLKKSNTKLYKFIQVLLSLLSSILRLLSYQVAMLLISFKQFRIILDLKAFLLIDMRPYLKDF